MRAQSAQQSVGTREQEVYMKIAVRMDDITPGMDWEKFRRFEKILDTYRIQPLIGVVPDNRDKDLRKVPVDKEEELYFWEQVKEWQKKGWNIALHGFQHVYTEKKGGCFPLNRFSEFAGLSFQRQKKMLEAGDGIFAAHGIETDIFMAPAHSYDRNTLRALKELGYTKITDGFGLRPYEKGGITFYPISFRLNSSLKRKKGVTTVVIHTNTMEDSDFERCRGLFETKKMISYGEYLKWPVVRRRLPGTVMEYILAHIKHLLVKLL